MTVIVDDTPDVWQADLHNLCLVRRFQGDTGDDGLMQLSSQLHSLYSRFYVAEDPGLNPAEWSLDDPSFRPPDTRSLLAGMRGTALSGCRIAFTGILTNLTEDLSEIPLCVLVSLCGGEVSAGVEKGTTHLVARQTAGWEQSAKIRQAARRKVCAISLGWTGPLGSARLRVACGPLTRNSRGSLGTLRRRHVFLLSNRRRTARPRGIAVPAPADLHAPPAAPNLRAPSFWCGTTGCWTPYAPG
jgi:hypothetical protein